MAPQRLLLAVGLPLGILIAILIVAIGGFLAEAARLAVDQPETAIYSYMGYAISHLLPLETWTALKPNLWWSHAIISLIFIAILPTTKMFHAIAVVVNVGLTNRKMRGHLRPMNVITLMEDEDMNEDEILNVLDIVILLNLILN